jgi:hypothetical protein
VRVESELAVGKRILGAGKVGQWKPTWPAETAFGPLDENARKLRASARRVIEAGKLGL